MPRSGSPLASGQNPPKRNLNPGNKGTFRDDEDYLAWRRRVEYERRLEERLREATARAEHLRREAKAAGRRLSGSSAKTQRKQLSKAEKKAQDASERVRLLQEELRALSIAGVMPGSIATVMPTPSDSSVSTRWAPPGVGVGPAWRGSSGLR